MPADDSVSFSSVTVTLAGFPALLNLSFEVEAGETVYLRGPNGAGKTTLLRTLAGLEKPTRGSAMVLGVELPGGERSLRALAGMMGTRSHLYEDLTVAENLDLARRLLGISSSRIDDAAELFGVRGRLWKQKVASLSAGQKRRVALAGLVAKNPRIWLLDEPHSSLDAAGRDLLDKLIVEATKRGAIAFVATHEAEAGRAGGRLLEMVGGTVRAEAREASPGDEGPAAEVPE